MKPSIRTEGEACAPKLDTRSRTARLHSAIRVLLVGFALCGTLGTALPASAQEEAPSAETSTSGDAIVGFAMQYLGSPYVWAGNTPDGFDCSGFTQFVIANTVGIDIGHGVAGQTGYGAFVEWGAWAPGDLVFFANTFSEGISHVGIYIGDGQFIHAENESTGVTISSLYSDYYSSHYYGAYRIV
jgi:cell wall-associated NlpC family hydrolase